MNKDLSNSNIPMNFEINLYCFDDGAFKEQLKEDAICDNNFECKSNVCLAGKCISSNLIQKFIEWLKQLFGFGKETNK